MVSSKIEVFTEVYETLERGETVSGNLLRAANYHGISVQEVADTICPDEEDEDER